MATYDVVVNLGGQDTGFTSSVDRAKGTLDQLNQQTGNLGRTGQTTDRQMARLGNAFERLTSPAGLAASAVTRLSGVVTGMATGAVIGAVSSLTTVLVQQAVAWLDLSTSASKAQRTLEAIANPMAQIAVAALGVQTRIEALERSRNILENQGFAGQVTAVLFGRITPEEVRKGLDAINAELAVMTRLRDQLAPPGTEFVSQEEQGRRIAERAQLDVQEAERQRRITEAGRFQEGAGANILALEQSRLRQEAVAEQGREQERLGLQIQQEAHQAYLDSLLTARSTFEAEYGQIVVDAEQNRRGFAESQRQFEVHSALELGTILLGAVRTRSKALFIAVQLAAVGVALVKAHEAAAVALAAPALNPAQQVASAALILKWGYINAAATAAVRLGAGLAGGGGGASPSGLGASGTGTTAGSPTTSTGPREVRLIIEGAPPVWSQQQQDDFFARSDESIAKLLKDTGGLGGVVLVQ